MNDIFLGFLHFSHYQLKLHITFQHLYYPEFMHISFACLYVSLYTLLLSYRYHICIHSENIFKEH